MAIDVGEACTDRADSGGQDTFVSEGNPANATGTIDYICLYCAENMGGAGPTICSCTESGDDITTRACVNPGQASGQQEWNAPGDFTAFDINIGDYIGIDVPDGNPEKDGAAGVGYWFNTNNGIFPCSGLAFTHYTPRAISLYCTGAEIGVGVAPTGALDGPLVGPFGGPLGGL